MNTRLLTWVTLTLLLFADATLATAQQSATGSQGQSSLTPPQANVSTPRALSPKEMAIERAKILMVEKKYEAGIQAYQDLLKADPNNAEFMNMIGIMYLNLSNFSQAKKYLERSAKADKKYPSAAASLREGLEEMFTVARLGIDGRLAKTLTTSNPVESMISIARATNRNVTRWRDGRMVLRWTAAL